MSTESLTDLFNTLSRQSKVDILEKLCIKSYRNIELSEYFHNSKERISERLTDLVASFLVIIIKRGAIEKEKHTLYVASPFGTKS